MQPSILIGLAAGFASAAIAASATFGGGGGRMLLYFLTPLPGFLAGLGWGTTAGFAAATGFGLGVGLLLGPLQGLVLFVSQGLPVAILCHLAQLGRTGTGPDGQSQVTEWYPIGRIVAIAVLVSAVIALLTVLFIGSDIETLRQQMRNLIEKVFLKEMPGFRDRTFSEAEIAQLTEIGIYLMPGSAAFSILGGLLTNLYLAGRITLASGRLPRPWPELSAMSYPRGFGFILAGALGLVAVMAGMPALFASAVAGSMFLAYLLLGLAIVHHLTRDKPARTLILWGVYVCLVILNTWAALALALLGVLEPVLPWRRKRDAPPQSPGPNSNLP